MKDFTLTSKDWNIDGNKLGISPGDRIIMQGNRNEIEFHNLKGTPDNPILITADGITIKGIVQGGRVVIFSNCSYVKFMGVDSRFSITGGGQGVDFRDLSTDVECANVDFHDISYLGFACKTDPTCDTKTQRGGFILKNVAVHDCTFKNIMTGEAIYIGESHFWTTVSIVCAGKTIQVKEHEVQGVTIYDNIFENIGRDGIQIGACTLGCFVFDNKISNYGVTKEYGQGSGITINPGTFADVYRNVIDTGSGYGILAQGRGGNIHHNLIMNTGWGVVGSDNTKGDGGGIMLAAYEPADFKAFKVTNNTLLGINRYGVECFCEIGDNILDSNIIEMKSGQHIKLNSAKTLLKDTNNIKSLDMASLKLDADYAPMVGSPAISGSITAGAYIRKPVVETPTFEIVDGVVYAMAPSGRYKLN